MQQEKLPGVGKREKRKKLPSVAASSKGRTKELVVKQPKGVIGKAATYGTPYNALNSQVLKFMPSQVQAALMAWAHTVANPRTNNPHAVPMICAPGASASVPQMYQCTIYGTAYANASGCVFIGANADGWNPSNLVDPAQPAAGTKFLGPGPIPSAPLPGTQGCPMIFTDATYGGDGISTGVEYPDASRPLSYGVTGLNWGCFPVGFIPVITPNVRYTNVAVELRARPIEAALYASGDIAAFNYRKTPDGDIFPNGNTFGDMLGIQEDVLSRVRAAAPNWPSSKWLTTVSNPNTLTCFGQWVPTAQSIETIVVSTPNIFILGTGLPEGAPIEFECTYVYAIYGARTYMTSTGVSSMVQVDGSRATPVIANGFTKTLKPTMNSGKPSAAGVAAVVHAERQDNRMPDVKQVISGIKAGADVFEAVTGTDIGAEIAEVVGGIAAMLL